MSLPDPSPVAERARGRRRRGESSRAAACAEIDLGGLPGFIGYALRRAQIAVFDDFIRSLSPLDLRPAQFSVLHVIDRNPGLKPSQLGDALGIQRTNLVALLVELEKRGLARRERLATDRRSQALFLTEAGRRSLHEARRLQTSHERRLGARLGTAGAQNLLTLLALLCVDEP